MNQMGYMTRSMYVFDLCHLKMYTGASEDFYRGSRNPETHMFSDLNIKHKSIGMYDGNYTRESK